MESEQRVTAGAVVERSEAGAAELASRYWAEVGRALHGLVMVRLREGGVEVRLLRWGPALLVLGPLETEVGPAGVSASHSILGGLLVRRGGGWITFEQADGELRSSITGFRPRRGPFYGLVQRKLHVAVSRRYFRRLVGGAR